MAKYYSMSWLKVGDYDSNQIQSVILQIALYIKIMTSFFEHQRLSYKKNYLRTLTSLASIDGSLDSEEKDMIVNIGMRRGLKEWQVREILDDTETYEVFIPDTMGNRMNLLYDVMQIVYADGRVSRSEVTFVKNIINALELESEIVQDLMNLFETHTPTIPEWNDFIENVVEIESKRFVTIL